MAYTREHKFLMNNRISAILTADTLRARALRGSALTFVGFGGAQFLRLLSNLILARLLFPEAFGLMALVQIFIVGLEMFSDIGIKTSIVQNERGGDTAFLNTAWTVQAIRGVILWLITCAIAAPAAAFYDAEMLSLLLPAVGFNAVLLGLHSTNMASANRDLLLGRLTALELGTSAFGLLITVLLAWWLQSVWALVIGGLISQSTRTVLTHIVLPGISNRFFWDPSAFSSLFNFGKYIFLGSMASFALVNADRVILGKYISLADLGIYNIAYFLASVPILLSGQMMNRVMLPLYRERPPAGGVQNRQQIGRARFGLTLVLISLGLVLGLAGDLIVSILYDERYATAGPILSLLAVALMPSIMLSSYGTLLLAAGSSGRFATFQTIAAVNRVILMWIGVSYFGVPGVITAMVIADVLNYPIMLAFIRKFSGWDLRHDALFTGVICLYSALIIWLHYDAVIGLLAF